MKYLIGIISIQIILANGLDIYQFDWSGQFGLVNHEGAVLWNKDWRSQSLLFDGTWAIYPSMYGPEIGNGFYTNLNGLDRGNDSLTYNSYFQYDQGDYLLDKFLFAAGYKKNKRSLWFHGFKRTYAGNFNQYSSGNTQPQQQSYLVGYESSFGEDIAGFSIGHFNTYSGYPDATESGLFDNRITSSNIFWKRRYNRSTTLFKIDHFLQRYKAFHSSVNFSSPRYLTRNQYELVFSHPIIGTDSLSINFLFNERFTRANFFFNERWNNYSIKYGNSNSNIIGGIFTLDDKAYFDYDLNIEKYFGLVSAEIKYNLKNTPTHPYFVLNAIQSNVQKVIKIQSLVSTVTVNFKKNILSTSVCFINDQNKFLETIQNDSVKNVVPHKMVKFFYKTNLIPYFDIQINYMMQNQNSLLSSGIGKSFELALESQFKLFNDFMDVSIHGEYKHFRNISNNHYIDPMEMVPVYHLSQESDLPNSINTINARISTQVSNFSISYEWYNLGEIILKSINSSKENLFTFHPNIPKLGRQSIISIKWMFED